MNNPLDPVKDLVVAQTKLIGQTRTYFETLSKLLDLMQRSTEIIQSAYEIHMQQVEEIKEKINGEEPASR